MILKHLRASPLSFPYNLIFLFIPINLIFDFLSFFYTGRMSKIAILRGGIIYIICFLICNKVKKNKITNSVIIFTAYIMCLLPFASDLTLSINLSAKVLISLFMLPIGYSLIRSEKSMVYLNQNIFLIYLISIIGFILYNIYDVGGYQYVDIGFDAGGLSDSWNLFAFCLLLAPLYLIANQKYFEKILFFIIFITLFIFLIISMKRGAILVFFLGVLIYLYNSKSYGNYIKYSFLTIIMLFALSPIFLDKILIRFEARQEKFQIENLKKESRYRESISIWNEVLGFEKTFKSLFGGEAFNSVGQYAGGVFGNRTAHVDLNLIVATNGLFGLFLYINIYYQIFMKFISLKRVSQKTNNRVFTAMFWTFFLCSLLTITTPIYAITLRSIIFLYMGAILGYFSTQNFNEMSKVLRLEPTLPKRLPELDIGRSIRQRSFK